MDFNNYPEVFHSVAHLYLSKCWKFVPEKFSYISDLIKYNIGPLIPSFINLSNTASLNTISYAFSRSKNKAISDGLLATAM